jgi:predicted Zn-dependent protease
MQAQKPPPTPGLLSPAESSNLDRARELAKAGDLDGALALARGVADARPDCAEPQFVTAELAYRTSRWKEAVAYFRRGGDPGDGKPLLLFYQAVALYEAGDRAGAAAPLRRCLPNIKHTPFVEGYARAILGETAPATQKH